MCRTRRALPVFMMALLLLCGSARGEDAKPASEQQAAGQDAGVVKYRQFALVKPGELKGRVLYPDLNSPAAEVPVRVWDVQKREFVQTQSTDKDGSYCLSELEPGRYFVVFGDRVNVDLRVVKDADVEPGPLNVIIPRGQPVFARMEPVQRSAVLSVLAATEGEGKAGEGAAEGAEPGTRISGLPLKTIVLGGGGFGTAVAIVEEVSEKDDHERNVISA